MAFLEETKNTEQPQPVETPQNVEPPKKEKLWKFLSDKKLYSKTYPEFEAQFSSPEKVEKLYEFAVKENVYSKGKEDFYSQFFEDVKKKEQSTPSQTGKQVSVPTEKPLQVSAKNSQLGVTEKVVPTTSDLSTKTPRQLEIDSAKLIGNIGIYEDRIKRGTANEDVYQKYKTDIDEYNKTIKQINAQIPEKKSILSTLEQPKANDLLDASLGMINTDLVDQAQKDDYVDLVNNISLPSESKDIVTPNKKGGINIYSAATGAKSELNPNEQQLADIEVAKKEETDKLKNVKTWSEQLGKEVANGTLIKVDDEFKTGNSKFWYSKLKEENPSWDGEYLEMRSNGVDKIVPSPYLKQEKLLETPYSNVSQLSEAIVTASKTKDADIDAWYKKQIDENTQPVTGKEFTAPTLIKGTLQPTGAAKETVINPYERIRLAMTQMPQAMIQIGKVLKKDNVLWNNFKDEISKLPERDVVSEFGINEAFKNAVAKTSNLDEEFSPNVYAADQIGSKLKTLQTVYNKKQSDLTAQLKLAGKGFLEKNGYADELAAMDNFETKVATQPQLVTTEEKALYEQNKNAVNDAIAKSGISELKNMWNEYTTNKKVFSTALETSKQFINNFKNSPEFSDLEKLQKQKDAYRLLNQADAFFPNVRDAISKQEELAAKNGDPLYKSMFKSFRGGLYQGIDDAIMYFVPEGGAKALLATTMINGGRPSLAANNQYVKTDNPFYNTLNNVSGILGAVAPSMILGNKFGAVAELLPFFASGAENGKEQGKKMGLSDFDSSLYGFLTGSISTAAMLIKLPSSYLKGRGTQELIGKYFKEGVLQKIGKEDFAKIVNAAAEGDATTVTGYILKQLTPTAEGAKHIAQAELQVLATELGTNFTNTVYNKIYGTDFHVGMNAEQFTDMAAFSWLMGRIGKGADIKGSGMKEMILRYYDRNPKSVIDVLNTQAKTTTNPQEVSKIKNMLTSYDKLKSSLPEEATIEQRIAASTLLSDIDGLKQKISESDNEEIKQAITKNITEKQNQLSKILGDSKLAEKQVMDLTKPLTDEMQKDIDNKVQQANQILKTQEDITQPIELSTELPEGYVMPTKDIEAKKADIERRRKKELDELENTVQLQPIEVLDENGNVISTTDKTVEINAKYDAELKALKEKQQPTEVTPTETLVKEYIENIEKVKSENPEMFWSVDRPFQKEDGTIDEVKLNEAAKEGRLIKTESGFGVVSEDGDIKGVFKADLKSPEKTGDKVIQEAIKAGGIKLDNFALPNLMKIYERNGFREVSRLPFNKDFAPEGWTEAQGTPDVVAMIYDPQNKLSIEKKNFTDYDEAMKYRDSYIEKAKLEKQTEIKAEPKTVADTVADDLFTHLGIEPEVKEAEKLNWTKQQEGVKETKISARNPITTEAAKDLKEGKITSEEYRAIVSDNSPVTPVTKFFDPATAEQVENSVDANKKQNANKPIDENKKVALRIDIPAFRNNNIWVISVHDGLKKTGEILSYKNAARITDVVFGTQSPKASLEIAAGGQKNATVGRIFGEWKNFEGKTEEQKGENAKKLVEEIANDPSWVQVGMNPFRHSYFYDRSSDLGRPVLSAKEVVQIGGLVYAKDVVYGDWNSEAFKVKGMLDKAGKPVYFQLEKSNKQEPKEPIKPSKKASAKEKEKYEKDLEKYKKEKALYDQDLEAISQANQDVKDIFDRAEIENNQASNEPITLTETEDKDIPTQKIEVSSEDKRPEASVMSKMMIKMGDWIQGAKVALGMSDTLRTGEREVVELDENGQKITKTIRDEGGIGFPFKSLMDLINGKIEAGKKAMGWAAVGEGAGTAMINAAKKSKKISGKELKEHYFKTLDLTSEQKQRIEDAIPDNKEYGLVTIYKMGEDGIKSNEAFSKEAFRLMDVKLTPEEKAKVFEIAANRLDKIEWGKDGVKEKYIDKLKSAKTFEELEFILNGEGSDMSLGTKAEIMQKIFLGTEKTTSTEKVNPLSTILKDKGITIESISKTLEEPIMTGIDAGQPMILLAIDPEGKVVEDKQRHANYSYGVEGFPIGLFKETSQMHHLSPEMMDTFIKTATVSVDENVSVRGSKEKARISISHDRNGNYIAEIGRGATKVQFTDKKGVFTKTDGKFYDSKGKPIKATAKPLILDSKEALSKELQKQGYTVSEASKKEYTQQISGSNISYLMQKAKVGIINFFKNPEITAQQKLVKYINKSFPNIEIVLDAKEYKRIEQDFKNKKLLNVNQETFGVVDGDTGKIFLNPTLLNNNTPIHELGHVWNAYAKEYKPEIYNKGIELITNTENSKYFDSVLNNNKYQKLIKDLFGDDALIKDKETGTYKINESHKDFKEIKEYISDEALSKAIGDKGELFVNEAQKRDFKQWLTKLYNAVKQIVGFESMSADQFQNLNLKSFVDAAIKDILGGKKISEFTSKDLAELTKTKPKFELGESEGQDAKIKDFIEMQREKGISDKDIKAGLEKAADRIGLDKNKIDELLTTKKEANAIQEPSPEGVLQPTQEGAGEAGGKRTGMEQAEQGAIPPKEGKPSEAEVGGAEKKIVYTEAPKTAAKVAELNRVRGEFGLPEFEETEQVPTLRRLKNVENAIADLKKSGKYEEELNRIKDRAARGEISDEGQDILTQRLADLRATAKTLDRYSPEYDKITAQIKDVTDTLKAIGTILGRGLEARKHFVKEIETVHDIEENMLQDRNAPFLTKSEKDLAQQKFDEYQKINEAAEKALQAKNEELAKLKIELEEEKAKNELLKQQKAAQKTTPKTKDDYKKERESIKQSIKDKWNNAGKDIISMDLPYRKQLAAITPEVSKLVYSYLEQAAKDPTISKKVKDIVEFVKKELKEFGINISDREALGLVSGEYMEKQQTRNELSKERYELQKEADLLSKIDDLQNDIVKEKDTDKQRKKSTVLKDLEKQLDDLQKQMKVGKYSDEAKNEAAQKSAQKSIDDLQEKIKNNELEIEKAEKLNETPKTKELREKRDGLRKEIEQKRKDAEVGKYSDEARFEATAKQQIAANKKKIEEIQQKIKKGDFAPETKKESILLNEELQKKNPAIYNEWLETQVKKEDWQKEYEYSRLKDQAKKLTWGDKFASLGRTALNTYRTAKATGEISTVLVQNIQPSLNNPRLMVKFIYNAFKNDLLNGKKFKKEMAILKNSELGDLLFNKMKVALYEPMGIREEAMNELLGGNENLLNKTITIGGKKYSFGQAFERLVDSYANNLRVSLASREIEYLLSKGKTWENAKEEYIALGRRINEESGHGQIAEPAKSISKYLNMVIWSTKMMASTFNVLGMGDLIRPLETAKQIGREAFKMNIPEAEKASKGYYTSLTPRQRMVAARNLGQFALTGLGIMGMIKLLNKDDDDVKVTLNPFDSSFGIKIGDKQVNPFGRYAAYMTGLLQVFFAMKYSEGEKKVLGVGYKGETSGDVAFKKFIRGKMRPDVGLAYDYIANNGKNYFTGEKIKPSDLAPAPMTWVNLFKDIQRDKISTSLWNVPYQFIGGQVRDQRDFEESRAVVKQESKEERLLYPTKKRKKGQERK